MPLYDYTCQKCGQQSEILVRAEGTPSCPSCGSEKMLKSLPLVTSHTRDANGASASPRPSGGCGSGCGCHPH